MRYNDIITELEKYNIEYYTAKADNGKKIIYINNCELGDFSNNLILNDDRVEILSCANCCGCGDW